VSVASHENVLSSGRPFVASEKCANDIFLSFISPNDEIKIKCDKCGAIVSRIPDVGTPWLDAGIVPYSTIRPPDDMYDLANGYPYDKKYWQEWFPADLITENFPGQFRNWFYAILTMSTVLENKAPFRVLHSYASLRDENGQEMHKSKGNAIWSDDAAEKVGADVMRWMFARHNPVQNLNFGFGSAVEVKRNLLTLWNVYSFFVTYANIDKFSPVAKKMDEEHLTKLDRWIRSRINSLVALCDTHYDAYDTALVVKATEDFLDDLSNWYVRRNRRRYWKSESDDDKMIAYLVLYECIVKLTKLISPIMPFLTEEMYQNLVVQVSKEAPESVHLCEFPVSESRYIDEKLEKEVMSTRTIVSLGRAARSKANIKVRQPLSEMIVNVPRNGFELSDDDKAIILEELNIKRIKSSGHNVLEKILVFNATPLLNSLGPKFGSDLNRIVEWIKALGQEDIQRLAKLNSLKRDINGKVVELTKDDVDIQRVGIPGWSVATEDEFGVGINTEISSDLENEGLVRELIHKIQLMRKQADFDLTDRIKVHYQTEPKLKQAITKNIDYLKNETLAVEVLEGAVQGEAGGVLSINGIETKVVLERVKTT